LRFLCVEESADNALKISFTEECFREAVKSLLMAIPLGKVTSYSRIAKILGAHPRSVARVLKSNEEPIIVPCHRVVHESGELGNYTFKGKSRPDLKKKLLILEGVGITDDKVLRESFMEDLP
jgi:methylated-DNA-[protein]-cysteine S-methyltransferase